VVQGLPVAEGSGILSRRQDRKRTKGAEKDDII